MALYQWLFGLLTVAVDVAIIGAGMTGASTAWWLRKLQPNLTIDVYERRKHAGGRVFTETIFGSQIDVGAATMQDDKYISEWIRRFNLTSQPKEDQPEAINNGTDFVVELGNWLSLNMIRRYGAIPLYRLDKTVGRALRRLRSIYGAQEQGAFYRSAEQLWKSVGLLGEASSNCATAMQVAGLDLRGLLMEEIVGSATRATFAQNASSMTMLPCTLALARFVRKSHQCEGGNMKVVEQLLKDATVNTHFHTFVKALHQSNGSFKMEFVKAPTGCGPRGDRSSADGSPVTRNNITQGLLKRNYDAVVIASPQYLDSVAQFDLDIDDTHRNFTYKHVYVTLTCGPLRGKVALQSVLFTASANSSIQALTREGMCEDGRPLWKFVSSSNLTSQEIDRYMDRSTITQQFQWYAYPTFNRSSFPKLELMPGLFYASAVEATMSSMELSAISGRNAALLVNDFLRTTTESIESAKILSKHRELVS